MIQNNRIGLMGGSFDPIHLGHVAIAREAREALQLASVLFIPSGRPPHKARLGASAMQRLEMTRLAVEDLTWAQVLDVEVFREGTIYTVDTLGILTARMPEAEFFYIIGADTLLDLPNWRNTLRVCAMCRFICVHRPGIDAARTQEAARRMREEYRAAVHLIEAVGPDLSSTVIRERIAQELPTRGMLPDSVRAYIDRENLYRL
jgi:nicotinate-nucleotide adenylyltransferase